MANQNINPNYSPLNYVGNRQTGNPQTQPLGVADQEDYLGQIWDDIDPVLGTRKFKFVLCGADVVNGTSIPIGDMLYYTDDAETTVTNKLTAAGAAINHVAGFAQVVMKPGQKSYIQLAGQITVHADSSTFAANEQVVPSTTTATVASVAVGAGVVYPVVGMALGTSTGSGGTVDIIAKVA